MTVLDPIELEVLRNALTAAAAEMDVTMWRTSRSTIVREMLDYSTAIFDANGNNVAQSARIPQHLNSMGYFLQTILDRFIPADLWEEGDVIISNDPYCGGQHLPDIAAFRPVFSGGRRVAIVGTLCHHLDVGGMSPGSYAANATEIYQEGLRIPPSKLFAKGVRNDVLWGVIAQNVRQPVAVMGDLQSQIASLGVGVRAVEILTTRYGADTLIASCSAMLDASEAAMRAAIRAIPDGSYEFEDFLDDDGIDVTKPVRIHARITVTGDRLVVDLSGSDREVPGPINATLGSTSSAVYFAIVAAAEHQIVPNAGCYRPIEIVAPEGLIVSAQHPAPVAHRLAPGHVLLNVLFGALAKAIPNRLPAAYYAVSYVCSFQTMESSGARKVLVEIEVGGCGAHPDGDGASAHSFGMHNNASIPVEMIESSIPITMIEYGLAPGTGGDGRHRGGLGLRRAWRIDSQAASFTGQMDRFRFRPFGLDGGEPGAAGQLELVRDNQAQALHSKISNMPLRKGDVIRLVTSGGGGLGPPGERQESARRRDREQGYLAATLPGESRLPGE
ncbi:hydantoinase B/oxoprolinase family protein [Bradyrhizobium sp. S69]|uniref:hydantoinase B/oxoprolinase family protein n=1 Tax=Bradyrhizobium sp. S69 TaxID=1641856 RepID=UPI001AED6541|nr:hydantoinase B/oxoprolinase family protein [Bradyrhizobium sp. S69]